MASDELPAPPSPQSLLALTSAPSRKRATAKWVHLPVFLSTLELGQRRCLAGCIACLAGSGYPSREAPAITRETLRRLTYGRGVPLRVLLALHRWARPYSATFPRDAFVPYVENGTERMSLGRLAVEALGTTERDDRDRDVKAVREAIRVLRDHDLVVVLPQAGAASLYIPHRLTESVTVPQALFRHGWVANAEWRDGGLTGVELALLVALLAMPQRTEELRRLWRRTPRPIHVLASRGQLVRPAGIAARLPVSDEIRSKAVSRLVEKEIIARVRWGREDLFVLLDPEVSRRPEISATTA